MVEVAAAPEAGNDHLMCDPSVMEFGVVIPHNEIGTDPGAISLRAGRRGTGAGHLRFTTMCLGLNDRGWVQGVYDSETAFHERLCCTDFLPYAEMSS